jgi:hypothetical protein
LVAVYVSDQGSGLWEGLKLGGNKSGFTDAVGVVAESMAATGWEAAELRGSVFTGEGFVYLEADLEEARKLLGTSSSEGLLSVEVRDGAGVVGAAEQAGDLLEAAGYVLLPMGYADAFPTVEQTQILVATGMVEQGGAVRALLGTGAVVEDSTLESGRVVVILGADFTVAGGAELTR